MTTNDYDPRLIDKYQDPRYLVHFQWDKSDDVYRYALVEIIHPKDIDSRNKEKKDEKNLTQGNMGKKISTSYVQQYSSKVSLLSQQTGKYGKSKVRSKQTKARKNSKTY